MIKKYLNFKGKKGLILSKLDLLLDKLNPADFSEFDVIRIDNVSDLGFDVLVVKNYGEFKVETLDPQSAKLLTEKKRLARTLAEDKINQWLRKQQKFFS